MSAGGIIGAEIVYIVVQRKIDTRFFIVNGILLILWYLLHNFQGKDIGTAPIGTVVDTTVVAPKAFHQQCGTTFDYFLSASSNPARYWVKHPRLGEHRCLSACEIQSLTYKLCHAVCTWSGITFSWFASIKMKQERWAYPLHASMLKSSHP